MSSEGEKQFAPTEKRKEDAAKKGDVARSRDIGAAAGILVGFAMLSMMGPWMGREMADLLRASFTFDHQNLVQGFSARALAANVFAVFLPVLILASALTLLTFGSQLIIASGRWVPSNIAMKGSRLDPLKGMQKVFGPQGWIEMGKGLLKVSMLGVIAFAWARHWFSRLGDLARANLDQQIAIAWSALLSLGFALGVGLLVIAMIDMPIQWMRRNKRLKMSHQDMRDEHKESEGSPEAKSHRRQRQRDIAAGALGPAMREAQFVITNPTHFSVALAYDPDKAPAPIVLAKGRGDKALVIRELAGERKLPTLEFPALARSIYYTTREKQMIRSELYSAVAAVVAFVFALGRGETPPLPKLDVPVTLRFDANGKPEG
ncbi:flagellar biosynthesis protein FlhB [Qipengyuania sp.]|uniref:EscU/YscU/HrcU family type III secretion system export apparatus switch protein n=1 Tax=Qipengyuania sp. TaxID=2004515 RepID=UPI0035C7DB5D